MAVLFSQKETVPADKHACFIYNNCVLKDFNHLTTGEKNGSTYTLCIKTVVFNWGIELGIGRNF